MNLVLEREHGTKGYTRGRLFLGEQFLCFTLEDQEREVKIPGETAIPCGFYQIAITRSERFQRFMPILLNVPGFSGVRIHPGNTASDTEGCILVGNILGADSVGDSRAAFSTLFEKMRIAADSREPMSIIIE